MPDSSTCDCGGNASCTLKIRYVYYLGHIYTQRLILSFASSDIAIVYRGRIITRATANISLSVYFFYL